DGSGVRLLHELDDEIEVARVLLEGGPEVRQPVLHDSGRPPMLAPDLVGLTRLVLTEAPRCRQAAEAFAQAFQELIESALLVRGGVDRGEAVGRRLVEPSRRSRERPPYLQR